MADEELLLSPSKARGYPREITQVLEKGVADDGEYGDQSKEVRKPKDTRIGQHAAHIGFNQFKDSGRLQRCGLLDLVFFANNFQALTMSNRVRIRKIRHAGYRSDTTCFRVFIGTQRQ